MKVGVEDDCGAEYAAVSYLDGPTGEYSWTIQSYPGPDADNCFSVRGDEPGWFLVRPGVYVVADEYTSRPAYHQAVVADEAAPKPYATAHPHSIPQR
ncbi:MAG: hypothetical protein WKH64_10535 [Chloroflexia bacterium]